MRRALLIGAATIVAAGLLLWSLNAFGGQSVWFAFLVVWVPMAWLGTISRLARPRLPDGFHRLRGWERSGRVYELVGVRLVKRLLRRGPLAWFNPDLHLPAERTPATLAKLDQRMRDAEAAHAILAVLTLGVVGQAAVRGWWANAAWTFVFNVFFNGYPVLLQRYNRAWLVSRRASDGL